MISRTVLKRTRKSPGFSAGWQAARYLIREGKTYQLPNVIRTHREGGMISLDEALVNLYLKRIISGESLLNFCHNREEVEKLTGGSGVGARAGVKVR